ncbi:hypothetical protein ELQ90_01745 [Labedella phragmitis]|uniref:Uncharacterized protein n=1 Tax=Labedella phragmitis TaxID=2498849 RepID=A0A3S4DJ47_9MICO|nr:hypothetical protein [Labedella phragmitis]RWZ52697.1 hypothetical protein ELQ90_01745 [Labedella phragmitis]
MDDIDAQLSRETTEALNASIPEVVTAAGHGRRAMNLLLGATFSAVAVGFLAAIFASALADVPAIPVVALVILVLCIAVLVMAFVVGRRAKRAFAQVAEIVRRERGATVVRVVDRQVFVRR